MSSELAKVIPEVLYSDETDVRIATESHQAEFPYGRDSEAQVTRREFCNFLFLTSSALLVGAGGFAAEEAYKAKTEVVHGPVAVAGAETMEPGTAMNFSYPHEEDTAILIRAKDGSYHAFGQKCTHLSCPVHYSKDHDRLECPCHEGGFSATTGEVLYGPPPRPLDKIGIEIHNGRIFAAGREVRGTEVKRDNG
jgi:nitrite reductase/ring-hydroxylating ferredoxin subunit